MILIKSLAITFIIMLPFVPVTVDGLWHCPLSLAHRRIKQWLNKE